MVKIYKQPFAHDGDAIAIPDASQPDGKMSSADGWTPDYQLPNTDPNYKPVGRQEMNGVFKEVTEALGQLQVQGSATWSPDGAPSADHDAAPCTCTCPSASVTSLKTPFISWRPTGL